MGVSIERSDQTEALDTLHTHPVIAGQDELSQMRGDPLSSVLCRHKTVDDMLDVNSSLVEILLSFVTEDLHTFKNYTNIIVATIIRLESTSAVWTLGLA